MKTKTIESFLLDEFTMSFTSNALTKEVAPMQNMIILPLIVSVYAGKGVNTNF